MRDQDIEKFSQFVKAWVKPGLIINSRDIENQISDLVEAMQDTIKAVGRNPTKACGRAAQWCNEECRTRDQEYRRFRHLTEAITQARKRFRAAVKEVKREHWRKLMEDATTDIQIFKIVRWIKPKLCKEPPPLKVGEDRWVFDPLERAKILRDTLMARFNAAHDLHTWEDEQPESIPWD